MATTLFLLRHAAHDHPSDMLCGRRASVALSVAGRRQAAALGSRFAPGALDALLTSPMRRCRETAAAVGAACGLRAEAVAEAHEVDFGEWTGRRLGVLAGDPRWQAWNQARDEAAAPGGEAMAELRARVATLLDDTRQRHPDGRVAIVSHAEVIRTAILGVLGLPLQAYGRVEVEPASISTLVLWPGGGKLLGLNDVAHLHMAAA